LINKKPNRFPKPVRFNILEKHKHIEIFKTNVGDKNLADLLVILLQKAIPDCFINFDLEDRDRVLRISGNREVSGLVIKTLRESGVDCRLIG
jgi:hypothetical protein